MALRKVGGTNRNNFESAALVCTTIIFGLPSSVSHDDVSIDMTTAHCQSFIDLYSGFFITNVALICIFENTLAPNFWQGISKEAVKRDKSVSVFVFVEN